MDCRWISITIHRVSFSQFSDSRKTWTSPTLQLADWPISRQYYRPQMRKRVSYPEVYYYIQNPWSYAWMYKSRLIQLNKLTSKKNNIQIYLLQILWFEDKGNLAEKSLAWWFRRSIYLLFESPSLAIHFCSEFQAPSTEDLKNEMKKKILEPTNFATWMRCCNKKYCLKKQNNSKGLLISMRDYRLEYLCPSQI